MGAVIPVVCVLLAAVFAGMGWIGRRVIQLGEDVAAIKAETRNNGGSSMRDAVDRIEGALQTHLIVAAGDKATFDEYRRTHN